MIRRRQQKTPFCLCVWGPVLYGTGLFAYILFAAFMVNQIEHHAPTTPHLVKPCPRRTTTRPDVVNDTRRWPVDVAEYVSFGDGILDGRGIGNQLFCVAAVVYVAELSGRKPGRERAFNKLGLDQVFNLNFEEFEDLHPRYDYRQFKSSHKYDYGVEDIARPDFPDEVIKHRSIFLYGFYQSWKYVHTVDRRLRQQHLKFLPDLVQFVEEFYRRNIPPSWTRSFTRVGIHVRRGDIISPINVEYGYTTPNATYFQRAMEYFTSRYPRVQFIVCSNDKTWMKDQIVQGSFSNTTINITFSTNTSLEQDFALLSHCDHVIMSTGTFGWWAAWIAKGTTIFFKNWPRRNSDLAKWFIYEDYFPPNWIPME